jgi:D-serine deaminase-like pyridoxal phosphate-dependent protein
MTSVASGNVVDTAEKAMQSMGMGSKHAEEVKKCVTCNAKDDPSGAKMTAVTFEGTKNMTVIEHHKPAVTDEADAIIRITSSGLCGTDLHIYLGHVPGMRN